MIQKLKGLLYFPIASYFRFFAGIRLRRWSPRILVITGSNGKTTLLHLLESQLRGKAKFSLHANSAFGIPFDILGLRRETLKKNEWVSLFLKAPLHAFYGPFKDSVYIVEADADRPGEGKFLAEFLKPEVVLWVSSAKTHSMNFDQLILEGIFPSVEEAIAYEYGYFLEYCTKLAIINGDEPLQVKQIDRAKSPIERITKANYLDSCKVDSQGTLFQINKKQYYFNALLPEEVYCSIVMCQKAVELIGFHFSNGFTHFIPPPGRGSIFHGVKNITIVDSCYNANLSSIKAMLHMFDQIPGKKKWVVLGDMLEQGKSEEEQHQKLAEVLTAYTFDRIILMGPRVSKYTYPKLKNLVKKGTVLQSYTGPREVLDYLKENIVGGEIILFKGARFMEGIIEHLLADKKDVAKLARREKIWEIRRKQWGL